ncbi:MAG: helicase-related protein, partial [Syntrophorhabdaceae bacterium]|nr:helicase-related protein [Syntrophorhabdaceae bacterium]
DVYKRQGDESWFVQVRTIEGKPDETVLTSEELEALLKEASQQTKTPATVSGEQFLLFIESQRIRLAYSYDPFFAVSLSGIQSLPHQIEAVYGKMLPQPRLRFLLADDPGAGKTIMAGLLIKELKLRNAIERILIIVPAALTIQWQDELLRFFNEIFTIINADNDKQQLINLWQRESQVITSLDYAKRPEVRERVWASNWDLIILDEAHKCSAYTKRSTQRAPEAEKTKRYQLIEYFSEKPGLSILFLTATPHQGDEDRFSHFLHLLDPDLFVEPHKILEREKEIRKGVLSLGRDCPWMIRRLKEDLRDFDGKRLFPNRHSQTVTFTLGNEEYSLYNKVSEYLNRFLVGGTGRAKQSIALTRTVLQRRLASSTYAIYESLKRRLKRQEDLLEELKKLPYDKQLRRLSELRGTIIDDERDEDDLDEQERDELVDEITAAEQLSELQEEVTYLKDLIQFAKSVYEHAPDSKLNTLKQVLEKAEFTELRDGRGKLLIFTEHRDTMNYINGHLNHWGYTTCVIHGGMNPHERKKAQETFRTTAQVCVATEAAGEGINLQFCHLMINYDLPWNPARLEQRMGRIHRIGQERDVYVFNFVADSSFDGKPIIEGRILRRLLEKIEQMREALGSDRVYDVIGQILSLNEVNLPDILRDAALYPARLTDYEDQIMNLTPDKLRQYEEQTGIALARAFVDIPTVREKTYLSEEKRLMPEYIAKQFFKACEQIGLKVEQRADGLWRIPYVPYDLRLEDLDSVKRFGKPEDRYNKITFYKEHLLQDKHLDAVLVSPGHPIYAVVDEKLNKKLDSLSGKCALFIDSDTKDPYFLHFFEMQLNCDYPKSNTTVYAELVSIKQEAGSDFSIVPPDIIHDLKPIEDRDISIPPFDIKKAESVVRGKIQLDKRKEMLTEREHQEKVIREYLKKSFDERLWVAQKKCMDLKARYESGEREVDLALREAEREVENIERLRRERLESINAIRIIRPGPVRYIGSIYVLPPGEFVDTKAYIEDTEAKRKSEEAAMRIVMEYEIQRGWTPYDVSQEKIGFDIRSLSPSDPLTGKREVRRIEVKGRKYGEPIRLTENEWRKAKQLKDTYWLYIVWNPTEPDGQLLLSIQNPAEKFENHIKEVKVINHYEISAETIERAIKSA